MGLNELVKTFQGNYSWFLVELDELYGFRKDVFKQRVELFHIRLVLNSRKEDSESFEGGYLYLVSRISETFIEDRDQFASIGNQIAILHSWLRCNLNEVHERKFHVECLSIGHVSNNLYEFIIGLLNDKKSTENM